MKTPKEFDYDLWIDRNDGQCYVRVKNTGEVSAVNADTFRFLRREEKRLRRDITPDKPGETPSVRNEILHPLSLDYAIEGAYGDIAPAWAMDRDNSSEDALFNLLEEELIRSLTAREADVYKHCIVDGMKYLTYAKETGIDVANVTRTIGRIRKRAKNFSDFLQSMSKKRLEMSVVR